MSDYWSEKLKETKMRRMEAEERISELKERLSKAKIGLRAIIDKATYDRKSDKNTECR